MNKDNSSQLTPTLPAHYAFLSHPLVHQPESPSYIGCRDILHNSTYLLDLFGAIDINGESDDSLSANGATALFWLTHTLRNTLRYVSLTLDDLQQDQREKSTALKQCAFVQALHDSDEVYKKAVFDGLAGCMGISRADVEQFIGLVDAE